MQREKREGERARERETERGAIPRERARQRKSERERERERERGRERERERDAPSHLLLRRTGRAANRKPKPISSRPRKLRHHSEPGARLSRDTDRS